MSALYSQRRIRTFSLVGLIIGLAVLGVSLAGSLLLSDQWIVFTLALACVSLQVVINDIAWRWQRRMAERNKILLHCQLHSQALHTLRLPLLTVQAQISDGLLILIWAALLSGGVWLSLRHGVQNGYLNIIWLCGCVLSVSWVFWVLAGRRCLNDDEIIISEYACLAHGRLDRWDLPNWHLMDVEYRVTSETSNCALVLRIWHDGPHQQHLIERYLPLPRQFASQARETCALLSKHIWHPSDAAAPDDSNSAVSHQNTKTQLKAARTRQQQARLEALSTPQRMTQLGNIILLVYSILLGMFSQWIQHSPRFTNPRTGASFAGWYLPYVALLGGGIALFNMAFSWWRNRSFSNSQHDETLLLFRMPSLWLESHLPESMHAARRELANDALLIADGMALTTLVFALRRPTIFDYFLHRELALLLVFLVVPFIIFIVYRDWVLRRRIGLVHLTTQGVWLYDRYHSWKPGYASILSCALMPAPRNSLEYARLQIVTQQTDDMSILEIPLDQASAILAGEQLITKIMG